MNKAFKISIAGSGKLANHLSKTLFNNGISIKEIYSRNEIEGLKLADNCKAKFINNAEEINTNIDLLIISISDDALFSNFLDKLPKNIDVVHTSGSVAMEVLKSFKSYGVFYPLQSFSKTRSPNFNEIPICIEACNINLLDKLNSIGQIISKKIYKINSEERKKIHIAAVFASNFTNYFYSIAEQILENNNIDRKILLPLIQETADRLSEKKAYELQTGPAIRGDKNIINGHIEMLKNDDLKKLYKYLSELIFKEYNEKL